MVVSAGIVKELRERTGAGFMDCKRALTEASGDMEKAIEVLRKAGLSQAAKRTGREAKEGLIAAWISEHGTEGALVEVNCETDFVAKTEDFRQFVANLLTHVRERTSSDGFLLISGDHLGENLLQQPLFADSQSRTVGDALTALIAKIGENIVVRRISRISCPVTTYLASYIHGGGRVGVIVGVDTGKTESARSDQVRDLTKKLSLHIAASSPLYVNAVDVPADVIQREKEIYRAQSEQTEKPAAVIEKVIDGKLKSFFQDSCLLEQVFVSEDGNNKDSVQTVLQNMGKQIGMTFKIPGFVRFRLGEAE